MTSLDVINQAINMYHNNAEFHEKSERVLAHIKNAMKEDDVKMSEEEAYVVLISASVALYLEGSTN